MQKQPHVKLPDLRSLAAGLTSVLRARGSTDGHVTVLDREPNDYETTFASEIVTCRLSAGNVLRLFCKYGGGNNDDVYGVKRGVPYEASVYRHVLQPLHASTLSFYGAHTHSTTGQTWLILEYLDDGLWVNKSPDPTAMSLATQWIGQFHAANEARLAKTPMPFLNTYDAEYYRGWARRTSVFAGQLHQRFPWLATLCRGFEEFATYLLRPPLTVIHGEYTVHNILLRDRIVYPIDWESAAIAVGEIDLASLLEGWPAGLAREWEREYARARWPESSRVDFEQRLDAARLYWGFRWVGDRPDWTAHETVLYEVLRSAGERLGLI